MRPAFVGEVKDESKKSSEEAYREKKLRQEAKKQGEEKNDSMD